MEVQNMRIKKWLLMLCMAIAMTIVIPTIGTGVGDMSTVEAAPKVKLNKKKVTLYVGKSTTLKLKGTKQKVKWSSNKKSVATVSSKGKVKAKKKGTATITAKVGKKKYKCKVTVKKKSVKSVLLSETSKRIVTGGTFSLSANVAPFDATNRNIKWYSSNPNVAKVNNGVVETYTSGTAIITATADGKSASCTVIAVPAISVDTQNLTIKDAGKIYVSFDDLCPSYTFATSKVVDDNIISVKWDDTVYANTTGLNITAKNNGSTQIILTNNVNSEKVVVNVTVSGYVKPVKSLGDKGVYYDSTNKEHKIFFSLLAEDKTKVITSGNAKLKIVNQNGEEVYNEQVSFDKDDFSNWTIGTEYKADLCCIKISNSDITKARTKNGTISIEIELDDDLFSGSYNYSMSQLPIFEASELCRVIPPEPTIACYYSASGDLKTKCDISETECDVKYSGTGFTLDLKIKGMKLYDSGGASATNTCRFKVKLYKDGALVDDKYVLIYSLCNFEMFEETITFYGLEEGVYEMVIIDYR
jgi:hypothetical protein